MSHALILTAIARAKADDAFGDSGWLTFYLRGDPEQHKKMESGLVALGAVNLGGKEGGFVYAKLPVFVSEESIEAKISDVRKIAIDANIEIDIIDLDASSNVKKSKFYTL